MGDYRLDYAAKLSQDADVRRDWAQLDARAALTDLLGQSPPYRWTYAPAQVIRNATAALLDLSSVAADDPDVAVQQGSLGRRIARTWESLAILGERTSFDHAILMAALAYELSGYQPNSVSLARHLSRLPGFADRPLADRLTVAFLQRLFLQVRDEARSTLKQPPVADTVDGELLAALSTGLMGAGLAEASTYFLSGNRRSLVQARELLREAEQAYARMGLVAESNAAFSLQSALPSMASRSTWTMLEPRLAGHPLWRRYLQLLARGPGAAPIAATSVSELWPSQLQALDQGLLADNATKIVRMPTSAGKTRIAEMALVHTLVTQPGSKCVYVAPYRALVSEVHQALSELFNDLGFRVPLVLGGYETDELEEALTDQADVLVVTPEKLDLLLRLQPDVANSIRLLILDEGHFIDQVERGAKFELLLTRLTQQLPDVRVLVLSAVVPNETLNDFAAWFGATEGSIVKSEWRPSRQRIALFEWRGSAGTLNYVSTGDDPGVPDFVPGVIRPATYEFINPDTLRTNRRTFPDKNKSQTAAELAYRFAAIGSALVFCSQTNFVLAVGRALLTRLNYGSLVGEQGPPYLNTSESRSAVVAREWLGRGHVVTDLLERGVAVHHGGLPDAVRKAVEDDFRRRRYRILLATNTLAQGVNLPLRTVIFHSCWRTAADQNPERISARDYWNIAGRAGRAGEETEGTIIHVALTPNDRRDFQYYLRHRESVEAVESALLQLLRWLLEQRVDESAALDYVDPEILALMVEERSAEDLDTQLQILLNRSLVRIQADRQHLTLNPLRRVLSRSSAAMIARVPSTALLPVFAKTGLSSQSCMIIYDDARSRGDRLRQFLQSSSTSTIMTLAKDLTDVCLALPEIASTRAFSGSVTDLLETWLSGATTDRMREEFGGDAPSPEELGRFIDDSFGYRLPWGLSSYLRIAGSAIEVSRSEMSITARFLPAMVKYGVPTPQAAWALAQGIPLRGLAIQLAERYIRVTEDVNDIPAFAAWLNRIDMSDLVSEFQLRGELLESFVRTTRATSVNPLLRDFHGVHPLLPLRTPVWRIATGLESGIASGLRKGQLVTLARDYDDVGDRNAISVAVDEARFGYLPRNEAQLLAPEMDSGQEFEAIVTAVELKARPSVMLEIRSATDR